jgi:hypothetical protein
VINLAPISQLYVHTNVSDYSSLSCTGAQDILVVIQVTESHGSLSSTASVESPLDTEAIRLEDGLLSTLRFSFRGPIRHARSVSSDDQRLHKPDHPRAAYYIR